MDISIRFANTSDADALKQIWKICFGDSDAYINFFFRRCFCPQNAVVAVCGKQAVGVIHMLPAALGAQKFMYGYAIGVLPEYRGNHICEIMHEFVRRYAEKEQFLYGLHPANEKLFSYYRRTGLTDMYSLRTFDASNCETNKIYSMQDIDNSEYYHLREARFSPLVSWSKDMIAYILDEARRYGGFAKKLSGSILSGKVYNDTVYVKETTMSDEDILQASGYIKAFFHANRIVYTLPNTSTLGEKEVMVLGFGKKNDEIYMNLFLD